MSRVIFTEEMKDYTILMPQMAPIHFELFQDVMRSEGHNVDVLKNVNANVMNEGNKYVHNDTCVPAILVIGQMLDAIKNSGYDTNKIALLISQTGGGCRASNYIHLLRNALKKANLEHIPVISLNALGIETNPGFQITKQLGFKLIYALLLGDLIMSMYNESICYEVNKGESKEVLEDTLKTIGKKFYSKFTYREYKKNVDESIDNFSKIKVNIIKKPKVGVVGEIYVKYSPLGNNNLEDFLIENGCEVVMPGIVDFILYTFDSSSYDVTKYGGTLKKKYGFKLAILILENARNYYRKKLEKTRFRSPIKYKNLKTLVDGVISKGMHTGEGWLLTAEMIELVKMDVVNIVCTQPFGCMPNHIAGKGMFKKIKELYPKANIVPIDYDTSSSAINQENRIKLMISNAFKNL